MPFGDNCKIFIATTTTLGASASTVITSTAVDTQGFRECTFIVPLGAITAGGAQSLKITQCDTVGGSYADLLGTNQTVADTQDDGLVYATVVNPQERFLKCVYSRATQVSTIGGIVAILSNPRSLPVTHGAGVVGEQFIYPAEGTA